VRNRVRVRVRVRIRVRDRVRDKVRSGFDYSIIFAIAPFALQKANVNDCDSDQLAYQKSSKCHYEM